MIKKITCSKCGTETFEFDPKELTKEDKILLTLSYILFMLLGFVVGVNFGEKLLTNELCNNSKYDFCTIKSISYKLDIKDKKDIDN